MSEARGVGCVSGLCAVEPMGMEGEMRSYSPLRESPPPPFIDTRRGGVHVRGDRGSRRLLPESRGCSGRALWKVHCGVWRLEWQSSWASSLALRRSRQRPCSSCGRRGSRCRVYRPPGVAWRRPEGPAGQGLVLVKAGAAPEGCAHAVRGLHGGESLKEVWGVGSIVAGAVPSTSCTASQVPTVLPQRPEWQSSDWSWRTGLRALWRSGWHLMPPYGGRVSGRAVCPSCRGVASSEAESICSLVERGGDGARSRVSARSPRVRRRSPRGFEGGADGPHCVRGPRIGLL